MICHSTHLELGTLWQELGDSHLWQEWTSDSRRGVVSTERDQNLLLGHPQGSGLSPFSIHRSQRLEGFSMSVWFCLTLTLSSQVENILARVQVFSSVKSLHISDFGTAKEMATTKLSTTLIGTPGCMAPEITSKGAYDPFKADGMYFGLLLPPVIVFQVWAFGVILKQLLGGTRSVDDAGPSAEGLLRRFSSTTVTQYFVKIIDDCTAEDPTRRPSPRGLIDLFQASWFLTDTESHWHWLPRRAVFFDLIWESFNSVAHISWIQLSSHQWFHLTTILGPYTVFSSYKVKQKMFWQPWVLCFIRPNFWSYWCPNQKRD